MKPQPSPSPGRGLRQTASLELVTWGVCRFHISSFLSHTLQAPNAVSPNSISLFVVAPSPSKVPVEGRIPPRLSRPRHCPAASSASPPTPAAPRAGGLTFPGGPPLHGAGAQIQAQSEGRNSAPALAEILTGRWFCKIMSALSLGVFKLRIDHYWHDPGSDTVLA